MSIKLNVRSNWPGVGGAFPPKAIGKKAWDIENIVKVRTSLIEDDPPGKVGWGGVPAGAVHILPQVSGARDKRPTPAERLGARPIWAAMIRLFDES